MPYEKDVEEIIRKKIEELFGENIDSVKFKGKGSICSTCKHFRDGKFCAKKKSFAGFATKLADCGEWEICNTGYNKGGN